MFQFLPWPASQQSEPRPQKSSCFSPVLRKVAFPKRASVLSSGARPLMTLSWARWETGTQTASDSPQTERTGPHP